VNTDTEGFDHKLLSNSNCHAYWQYTTSLP